ncbi:pentapeptide repeat-containing protein [Streptomyces sp. NPDC048172]|uniref:pentapeptide repeat-containing protein n=1 Tax=Streptomyces sp. NPDC048172 TaxID=3365505 RepID=UPI00371F2E60
MAVASLVAVGGLWYTAIQTQQSNQQARAERSLSKEGQITDRYTAAVENLGDKKVDVRLGGVYALQRIMQDSTRDHTTIANVLSAYARTYDDKSWKKGQDSDALPVDVQAALTVLATRDISHDKSFTLNLKSAQLPNADLTVPNGSDREVGSRARLRGKVGTAQLQHADLRGADLSGAALDADLRDADLSGAKLRGAKLHADLRDADLRGANLNEADLSDTKLLPEVDARAYLSRAYLRAYLRDTFEGALLKEMIRKVGTGSGTKLREANLSDAKLREANLFSANLREADLSDAKLREALLFGADLRGADLRGADLRDTDLRAADLRDAVLFESDLQYAKPRSADLRGADLRGADLNDVDRKYAAQHGARV